MAERKERGGAKDVTSCSCLWYPFAPIHVYMRLHARFAKKESVDKYRIFGQNKQKSLCQHNNNSICQSSHGVLNTE